MTPRAVLASFLRDQMATRGQGARVLVIRNTVQAARDCLTALNDAPCLCVDGVRTLRHARFAVEDRARLGKASRAGGLVVCGSQTLEQSLDILCRFPDYRPCAGGCAAATVRTAAPP